MDKADIPNQLSFSASFKGLDLVVPAEAVFKEKRGIRDPMLTITSLHLIVDSEVQLSTPTMTYADECFSNYSKMEQLIGIGRGRGGS